MNRLVPWVLLIFAALLFLTDPALAQDPHPAPAATQGDTFPAAMGYAALALATTVWGGMSLVVRHLWKGLSEQTKLHQKAVDTLGTNQQSALDAIKIEHKTEVDGLRDRLETEQRERRGEVERLTKEQKDIFRETLITSADVGSALKDIKNFLNDHWEDEGD